LFKESERLCFWLNVISIPSPTVTKSEAFDYRIRFIIVEFADGIIKMFVVQVALFFFLKIFTMSLLI